MAEAIFSEDEFQCSVCLDLLKDPVTISCGHSYCRSCISQCWDKEDQKKIYLCPQCRKSFSPRPALAKNIILAEMVEKLKIKSSSDCYAGLINHDTVSAAAQRTETQKQLMETQREFKQKIQQREKYLQTLNNSVDSHKRSALQAKEDTDEIFTEMIQFIQRRCDEVKQQIRDQEKTSVSEADGIMEKLQQEIKDLKRKDREIEKLLQTQDHISFIQSFPSLSALQEFADVFTCFSSFEDLTQSVHQMRNKLEEFCNNVMKKIHARVTVINIDLWSRRHFLRYSRQFTLDRKTMSKHLGLSKKNRVILANTQMSYPDHPKRFEYPQVLCKESVSGRCYWELDWTGDYVDISVAYKSISRKGRSHESWFGGNNQSWSLFCSSSGFTFFHNNIETKLPFSSISRRVGVFVDHEAGTLSFYSVSDTMTLIHRVQTTFTQPLCPGVSVCSGSSVKLCDMSE